MGPVRVALIGLSGTPPGEYEGTSWCEIAHLPYLSKASSSFEVVALLNSSVASAQRAIQRHGLPPTTKAYGDPEALAADPDVDLVTCSVRVDRHLQTVRPSIIAGKTVFVEWPMDRDLAVAREMTELASKHNSKTILGLQGSYNPLIRKVREIIDTGKIGRLLSSSFIASLGNLGATESRNVRYFLDRSVGGSPMSIHLGHSLECIVAVLGEFKHFESLLALRRTSIDIVDRSAESKVVQRGAPNTVPDQIMFHGTTSVDDAATSVRFHGGPAFPGSPALTWRIQGEKGEILLTADGCSLNVGPPGLRAKHLDLSSGQVEDVVPEEDEWDSLPRPAQNIARLYEAVRKGEWYPDFSHGLERHRMIQEMWQRFDDDH